MGRVMANELANGSLFDIAGRIGFTRIQFEDGYGGMWYVLPQSGDRHVHDGIR
jgi:hypothetical protein